MQTDLDDAVTALAKIGHVDPERVCIVGASYGGYAALAGATFTPIATSAQSVWLAPRIFWRCILSAHRVMTIDLSPIIGARPWAQIGSK